MFTPSVMLLLSFSSLNPWWGEEPMTRDEVLIIRNEVYNGKLISEAEGLNPARLVMPKKLVALYQNKPKQVTHLLMRIVDGGRAEDSVRAAAYGIELLVAPGVGVAIASSFEPEKYDVQKESGETPRETNLEILRKFAKFAK